MMADFLEQTQFDGGLNIFLWPCCNEDRHVVGIYCCFCFVKIFYSEFYLLDEGSEIKWRQNG